MHIFKYCMPKIGVCMIYIILYMYKNLGCEISYEYLLEVPEPTNGEIIPKLKLAK